MKLKELNEKMLADGSIVIGTFQRYKAEQTEKAGANEKFGILVGDSVIEFTVWAPKGTTVDKIPRPVFAGHVGTRVAVINASLRLDGKYLRTGGTAVVQIES